MDSGISEGKKRVYYTLNFDVRILYIFEGIVMATKVHFEEIIVIPPIFVDARIPSDNFGNGDSRPCWAGALT